MKLSIKVTEANLTQSAIVGIYEHGELTPSAQALDKKYKGCITNFYKINKACSKQGYTTPIFNVTKESNAIILLVGCGKKTAMTMSRYRAILLQAVKSLADYDIDKVNFYLTDIDVEAKDLSQKIKYFAEIVGEGLYHFDLFKSTKEPQCLIKTINIALTSDENLATHKTALEQGKAIASGVTLTKNLANLPSNICTPTFLAEQAKELANAYKTVHSKILNEDELRKLKMGALLGVSQGSAEEAKLICIEYQGAAKKHAPIALVGKGVTFDTGGISLKSADAMVGMKYDMCGAATVLGVIKAAAEMELAINIVGIIPTVENMPGGTAYKPEDILTSMSGITIEVISTDAEGRLILADALTYCENYQPAEVIDIATLTGAVVIALGFHASGLIANNDEFAKELMQAGIESHDRAWQLPMFDEYQEQIKSPFADIANTGGRAAGTITAACFLSRFTKKFKWAHLDVAGTAAMMVGTSDRKATGRPVPLLMQHLINRASKS